MQREIMDYIKYLATFKELKRPQMPNFDVSAYTDIEYHKAMLEINEDFDKLDDFEVYEQFLKGE